jgi:hypothetical protein
MLRMKEHALADYAKEREVLPPDAVDDLLQRGLQLESQTTLTRTLAEGGSALFPHTHILSCGDQIAAAAYAAIKACRQTGKNQILVIGVLHGLKESLRKATLKEINGEDVSSEPYRGVFGPGLPQEELFSEEYSMDNFLFIIDQIGKRADFEMPKVIVRYTNLAAGHPETLPYIEELELIAKDSIVIATADLCHHGSAYEDPQETAFPIGDQALKFVHDVINHGFQFLAKPDYIAYRNYARKTKSDSKEVGQILLHLLGPLEGSIHDLRLVDVSYLFEGNPEPNWVAVTLVELKSKGCD